MKPSKSYLRQEMWNYLVTVPDAAEQEFAELDAWVRQGNSPYSNPLNITDEQGREMPFIHALRAEKQLAAELVEEPEAEATAKSNK